ncbi:hypothetical protein [Bradyrhizobium liaoningense]|uniref:hypothetical protein n=1 Tax=Bradyrhizobium liaoningense TaxID=43992 RepID=UPI002011C6B2|nr:hypothetical protein [Bradyrhizobium liaoningense]
MSAADDEVIAHDRLRRILGFILRGQHHARNLSIAGTSLDQAALAKAYAQEDWTTVERLVSDEVVKNHAASGTPEQFVPFCSRSFHPIHCDFVAALPREQPQTSS